MTLNIKKEETHRLARELADLTGESVTEAVTEAVRERLERLKREKQREGLAERLMQIARDCSARLPEEIRTLDHGEYLYDERGLPK